MSFERVRVAAAACCLLPLGLTAAACGPRSTAGDPGPQAKIHAGSRVRMPAYHLDDAELEAITADLRSLGG